ncbi:MAG: NAD(P)-dependent oxidoreductase [Bacteroidota bacterium]
MQNNGKVLITDSVHPILLKGLAEAGFTCDYYPDISLTETRQRIDQYVGVIINSKIKVDRSFLDLSPQLEFIGRLGSGLEIIDLEYAATKGVAVYNSPEGNRNAVAEHLVGMLLALANNLLIADREVRQKVWLREKNRGFEISGKTIALIGFGHTGKAVARRLAGFQMNILAYDKYVTGFEGLFPQVVESDWQRIFEQADIVSFHLPLTDETKGLVDLAFLEQFQKPIVLINTSRGAVVNLKDLLIGIDRKMVIGACLDVYENEKPGTFSAEEEELYSKLYLLDNVVLSPHIAGWTHESKFRLARILLQKILK